MSSRRTPNAPPESNVTAIDIELPAQLRGVADRIRPFEEDAANRLIAIADQLPDVSNPNRSFDHLLNIDPYQIVSPDTIERHASEFHPVLPKGFGRWETLRNVLVLLPILFTWIALSVASFNYAQTVNKHRDMQGIPFLLLWEQGFKEGIPFPSFSLVALADFVILGIVILLTWYFHQHTDGQAVQIETQREALRQHALALRQELEDVLWRLSKQFSQRRLLRAPDQGALEAADQMKNAALILETTTTSLTGYEERAASRTEALAQRQITFNKQQEELRNQFLGLTQQQQNLVNQVSTSVQQLDAATQAMRADLQRVSGEFSEAVASANQAAQSASEGLKVAQNAVSEAGRAASAVAGVEKQLSAVVGQFNGIAGTLDQTNRALAQSTHEAGGLNQGIQTATQSINAVATRIDAVVTKIDQVAAKMDVIPNSLQNISGSLQASAAQTAETARATAGLVQQLGTLASQLPAISNGMQAVANNLGATSHEMARTVAESKVANQNLLQASLAFSNSVNQTKQVFTQEMQQTAQSFATGAQQMVTKINEIHNQLNHLVQLGQNPPGQKLAPTFGFRFAKWFMVLLLAVLLLPVVILIPWFFTQAMWVGVIGLAIVALILSAALAATIAWQR